MEHAYYVHTCVIVRHYYSSTCTYTIVCTCNSTNYRTRTCNSARSVTQLCHFENGSNYTIIVILFLQVLTRLAG